MVLGRDRTGRTRAHSEGESLRLDDWWEWRRELGRIPWISTRSQRMAHPCWGGAPEKVEKLVLNTLKEQRIPVALGTSATRIRNEDEMTMKQNGVQHGLLS